MSGRGHHEKKKDALKFTMIICIIATTAKEDVGTFDTMSFGGEPPA